MQRWHKVAIGIGAVVAAGLSYLYSQQQKLIYFPQVFDMTKSPAGNPTGYRHPGEQQLEYNNVEIQTEDKVKLRGWLVFCQNPTKRPTIIYYHENAGNIGYRIPFIELLVNRLKVNVLLVAYRGYSDSQGKPSQKGIEVDGMAIIQWLLQCTLIDPQNIYVFGRSLGGAVAIYVASHPKYRYIVKGLIVENTFTSIGSVVKSMVKVVGFIPAMLLRNNWDNSSRISQVLCPIYFIRSMQDQLINPRQMEELSGKSQKQGTFRGMYDIEEGTHNDSWTVDRDQYASRVKAFIENVESGLRERL